MRWLFLWWLLLVIVVRINCDEKITTTQVMIVMCDDAADVDDSGDVDVSEAPLTEGGQTLTIEVGMTSVTMLSRRMGRRPEEKKTTLTQVWMVGLRPPITVGPGFCYFRQLHP